MNQFHSVLFQPKLAWYQDPAMNQEDLQRYKLRENYYNEQSSVESRACALKTANQILGFIRLDIDERTRRPLNQHEVIERLQYPPLPKYTLATVPPSDK